jgi:small GTP-binding protein
MKWMSLIIIFAALHCMVCEYNVLIIGKTGTGKSTLINNIFGKQIANVGEGVTGTYSITKYPGRYNNKHINFIDTPGFFDVEISNDYVIHQLSKLNHINIILLCHDISQSRILDEDRHVLNLLIDNFGNDIFKHVYVVFTKSNLVKNNDVVSNVFANMYEQKINHFIRAYDSINVDWVSKILTLTDEKITWFDFEKEHNQVINIKMEKARKEGYYNEEYKRKIDNYVKYNNQDYYVDNRHASTNSNGEELMAVGSLLFGLLLFSDENLKDNLTVIECGNTVCTYTWQWNNLARDLYGLYGSSKGYVAQEIEYYYPQCVRKGVHMAVNYDCVKFETIKGENYFLYA